MSSNFITNKELFLSDIINGILPKTDAVCMLIGYFYYSGYIQLSEQLKDKQIRILVGLDVELQMAKHIREVETFRKGLISRSVAKEEYYKQFVQVFNNSDFLDTAEKQEQFKMFYGKILDGTLEIRKTLEPCHSYNPTRVIQRIGRINRINKKVFDELYIYNYFPTDVGEAETRTKEISTLKMAMIHAIMGEDTKALTKEEEVKAFFKERYRKEIARNEETSWDTPYRKLLNSLKGTEIYDKAMELPHRARTARNIEKPRNGVLMFGRKGDDFVFKIGDTATVPIMIPAEEAIALFEASIEEKPVEPSSDFDAIYQRVKASLFSSDATGRNEKELLNALAKVKLFINKHLLPKDYLEDLRQVIQADALSGYEIRYINQLAVKDAAKLQKEITAEYLARVILAQNKAGDSKETLILSEELR